LWDDPQAAQTLHQRLNGVKEKIAPFHALRARIDDSNAFGEILAEEPDEAETATLNAEVIQLTKDIDRYELEALLKSRRERVEPMRATG